jgi:hypothetical protein
MTSSNFIIVLVAMAFALMGVVALVAPSRIVAQFDVKELSSKGRSEVRAVYGGFGVAMSTVLFWALRTPTVREGICIALAGALAGMALGRAISALIDRGIARFPVMYLFIEAVGAALLFAAR